MHIYSHIKAYGLSPNPTSKGNSCTEVDMPFLSHTCTCTMKVHCIEKVCICMVIYSYCRIQNVHGLSYQVEDPLSGEGLPGS